VPGSAIGPSTLTPPSTQYGPPLTQGVLSSSSFESIQSAELTSTQSSIASSLASDPELDTVMVHETDLVYSPGSSRLALTRQHPLVRIVIQDAFDILHCSLLSINAFPDGDLTVRFIRDVLLRSARSHRPGALPIHQRLLEDTVYFRKIVPLVSPMNLLYCSLTEATYSHVSIFLFIVL
jgi:hypothetical protein